MHPCPICKDSHDETVNLIWEAQIGKIPSAELQAELDYVERELSIEMLPERKPLLLHRRGYLLKERSRRGLREGQGPDFRDRIERAKAGCDLEQLINLQIGHMSGNRTWMHCDAHGTDSTASLVVYVDAGRWWCYGCSSGGDALDWMIARQNLGFKEALEALEKWRGIEAPRVKAIYE